MWIRRVVQIGWLSVVVLVLGGVIWVVCSVVPIRQYHQASRRIGQKIAALEQQRPANLDPHLWREAVVWAGIASGNICFSERHASYRSMLDFEAKLDERLKQPVDLETLNWIGDRLAETGPRGQQYMARWRLQWNELMDAFEQQSARREPDAD